MNNRGFTLIELLVVVAIIGLLASVVIASLASSRAKSRDARRIVDMEQIYNAIMLYDDQYNCLPKTSATACTGAGGYQNNGAGGWDYSSQVTGTGFMSFLKSAGFIAKVPVDPINNMTGDGGPSGTFAYAYYCYFPPATDLGLRLHYYTEVGGWQQIVKNIQNNNGHDSNFSCK